MVVLVSWLPLPVTLVCCSAQVCVCPDRWGFCGWSFLNPNHELNVVENMEEDAR
jgi:hypothetical protein